MAVGHSISWPAERAAEKHGDWKRMEGTNLITVVVLLVSAVLAGCTGRVVAQAAAWVASIRQGHCLSIWYLGKDACCAGVLAKDCTQWVDWPWALRILIYLGVSAACASLAAAAVKEVSPEASMSGIPQLLTFTRGYDMPGLLAGRTLFVKLVGMGLTVASGLWLGIEAPMVHVAACLSGLPASKLGLGEAKIRSIATAAAAAGISVAFGAPVGGLLFVLEIFQPPPMVMWQGFVCAMVAALATGSATTGVFRVADDRVWHSIELIPFACIGALGGLYGALAIRANVAIQRSGIAEKAGAVIATLAVTLVTAATSLPVPLARQPHSVLLQGLFAECTNGTTDVHGDLCGNPRVLQVLYTFITGAVLMPITFGLPIPSGILFPSIVVGALGGRLAGLAMHELLENLPQVLSTGFCPDGDCITPGVYAVVGAGAVLTGISRLTVSTVVILFELTGALSFVVPLMVSVMVSKWVGDGFGSLGIYDTWIELLNLPSLGSAASVTVYPDVKAEEFMTPTSQLEPAPVTTHRGGPVFDTDGKFVEFIGTSGPEPVSVLSPQASLVLVATTFRKLGVRVIVFCDRGYLKGLVTRKDIVKYLRTPGVSDSGYELLDNNEA